jgi:tRNA/tmRNA/rRNA uracil-C5-methylase (TrmA/RlmC/RlmD family)
MSKLRLYIDEDAMDADFVQALRSRNVDVLTVAEVGMLHRVDEEQIVWAREDNRTIFSFNARDFYQLHTTLLAQGLSHAGIILAPQQRYGIGELMRGVLRLVHTKSAEEMQGQVEFLSNWILEE